MIKPMINDVQNISGNRNPDRKEPKKWKNFALLLGPIMFCVLQFVEPPKTLSPEAFEILSVAIWMAIWWVSEAVPIAVTALLPIVLFPLTGALTLESTTPSYGHKYVFLYIGGFILALAIERWQLHRRIALNILNIVGSKVKYIILGFMVSTAFLSMWISNTATAVMMLPIGVAIIKQFGAKTSKKREKKLGRALMLSIAYSASIGGFASLIGTPPNLVLAGVIEELYGVKISFMQWMQFALPVSILLLFLCWIYLTKFAFKISDEVFPGGHKEIKSMLKDLGKISYEEKAVLIVFILTALAWVFRSFIQIFIPIIDDTIIATIAAITLFMISAKSSNRRLLLWSEAVKLPWGIILLFGGGMALAKGFTDTGLADWIAAQFSYLKGMELFFLMLILVAAVNFLTEITSNLATTAMLLPVLAPIAFSMGIHPYMIMVAATLAASCAFMLPVATPPNAVVFGSGYLKISSMVKVGVVMNIVSILIVTLITYFLLPYLWDIDKFHFPQVFRQFMDTPNL